MFERRCSWKRLGAVLPTELAAARIELHYAAQSVSGVGRTFVPTRADDSHTSLQWMYRRGALSSQCVEGTRSVTAELQLSRLALQVFADDQFVDELLLEELTAGAADRWIADAVVRCAGRSGARRLTPIHYDLPPRRLSQEGPFRVDLSADYSELSRWFNNAAIVLDAVREREPRSSPIRCWPHHFDIATLIDLGEGRSVGVGLSPGDASYEQPYFYVGPYPYPSLKALLKFAGPGHWHTHGFVAAVLTGQQILAAAEAEPQRALVNTFLDSAISISKEALNYTR